MTIHHLLLHKAIGETRAIALDHAGRAVALFHDRWAEQGIRLRWGDVLTGIVRKCSPADGGAFISLEGGQEGFLARRDMGGLVEGAHGTWRVSAEARADKLAKLVEATQSELDAPQNKPLERWQASLPCVDGAVFEETHEAAKIIDETFGDALTPRAPLSGGGRLQITPTPALVAVDVDTVGRKDKGRASARARAVGLVAAEELARQAVLRGLGGALVLDCIAPLARRDGPELKKRFVETFRTIASRRVECLPPSPFGLMEAVVEWRWQPLHEACFNEAGHPRPLAVLLDGLRQIESAAQANTAAQLKLDLPVSAFEAFLQHKTLYETALSDRFGARIIVAQSKREKIEVAAQ